jgi:hypothetical protein
MGSTQEDDAPGLLRSVVVNGLIGSSPQSLLDNNASQAVTDEDNRTITCVFRVSLVSQQRQQFPSMISNSKSGEVIDDVRIIAKCHNTRSREFRREEILEPHRISGLPRRVPMPTQAVDCDNAVLSEQEVFWNHS